jgi:transposase, IS5 family
MRRRAAVEPLKGHIEAEYRMDRHYLKGRQRTHRRRPRRSWRQHRLLLRWLAALLPIAELSRSPTAAQTVCIG